MVIQRTVNPPPLARLVRSQYPSPVCCIKCNDWVETSRPNNNGGGRPVYITSPIFLKESNMKKKNTSQPRNYLVKLALFRKAGSHRKSNKAVRRNEKVKKLYPIVDKFILLSI